MNNIVKNAIAAAKNRMVAENEISGYDIYWLTIKPVNGGIVTEADKKKLHKSGMSFPNEKEIKYHIPKGEYEKEVARLKGLKLSKPMQVTYITDKQFGRKMGPTQKQMEGSFVIGNCEAAGGTVSNALAAHRAKNEDGVEAKVAKNASDIVDKQFGEVYIADYGSGYFDCEGQLGSFLHEKRDRLIALIEKRLEKAVADYKKAIAYIKTR